MIICLLFLLIEMFENLDICIVKICCAAKVAVALQTQIVPCFVKTLRDQRWRSHFRRNLCAWGGVYPWSVFSQLFWGGNSIEQQWLPRGA